MLEAPLGSPNSRFIPGVRCHLQSVKWLSPVPVYVLGLRRLVTGGRASRSVKAFAQPYVGAKKSEPQSLMVLLVMERT